jgi:hypothetical protein
METIQQLKTDFLITEKMLRLAKKTNYYVNVYSGLNWTVREINSTFKIKVNGINFIGQKMNTLVGVSGLINLIGVELCNILFERAFNCIGDKCVCKLRRGLKITFYLY